MSEPPRFMSEAEAEAFAAFARTFPDIWAQLLDREREIEIFNLSGRPMKEFISSRPSMLEIIGELLDQRFGEGHCYNIGRPTIAIRKELRLQLGYSLN